MKHTTAEKIAMKALYLEDSLRDAEIIRESLIEAGFDLSMDYATNEKEYVSLLRNRSYDVILSDFKLPGFDAFTALRLAIDICPDVPFICVSGSIGEETAIELIKKGAVDYILKDRLVRLPFAIKRALDEAKEKETGRQSEEALRDSERRFQILAEISPVGIFRTDAEGSTTYVNPRWCQISGISKEEALGSGWLSAIHSEDKDKLIDGWKKAAQVHDSSIAEYRFVRKDGSIAWVMGQAIPERNSENTIVGYVGTVTDITERKLMEEALRESERQRSVIYDTVGDVIFNLKLEKDGSYYFDSVNQCFLTTTGLQTTQIVGKRVQEIIPEPSLSLALEKYGEAIREKKIVRWEETSEYPTGQLTGEVSIAPVFDDSMNCVGLVGSVHDITERKRAERALRESEDKFKYVFDRSLIGKSITFPSGEIHVNKAFCEMLGYALEELQNRKWQDLTHPDDIELTQRALHPLLAGEKDSSQFIKRYIHKSGAVVWAEVGTALRLDEGKKPLYFITTVINITERKRAEEELSALTLRQQAILAAVPDIIMEVDNNKLYTWTNEAGKEFFGNDVIGKEASYYFEGTQETYDVVQPIFMGDENTVYVESWQRRKDGEKRLLAWWCRALKDNNGNVTGALSSARDITERKRAEEALSASEIRYRRLFEAARDGILILDAETGMVVDVNPFLVELLGYSREQFLGKRIWELGIFKDIAANKLNFTELQQKEFIQYENLPLETAKGRLLNVEFVSHVYQVAQNKVMQCNVRDVTERKLAEEKVLRQLEELRRWQDVTLGREDRNRQLKSEVNELLIRLGETIRYPSQESDSHKDPQKDVR